MVEAVGYVDLASRKFLSIESNAIWDDMGYVLMALVFYLQGFTKFFRRGWEMNTSNFLAMYIEQMKNYHPL